MKKETIILVPSDIERIEKKGYTSYSNYMILTKEKFKEICK